MAAAVGADNRLGTCCYEGTIPTNAIDKAVIVKMDAVCDTTLQTLLFRPAVFGSINSDYYSKTRHRLDLIDQYLFKEPWDIDTWVKEFPPTGIADAGLNAFRTWLNTWLEQYRRTIKELHVDRKKTDIGMPILKYAAAV